MSESTATPGIYAAMAAITGSIGGVAKTRKNVQQGYQFRGIADILLAAQPLLAKHGVTLVPHAVLADAISEHTSKSGSIQFHVRQTIEFRFWHLDGSFVSCVTTGEAMDSGDKASNKAMTAAQKYALVQAFSLPEEDPDDPDATSPQATTGRPAVSPLPGAPAAAPSPAPPAPPTGTLTLAEYRKQKHASTDPEDVRRLWYVTALHLAGAEKDAVSVKALYDEITATLRARADAFSVESRGALTAAHKAAKEACK